MSQYTEVRDEAALEAALKLAKGSYQRNILLGNENLSGSSLRGAAKKYGMKYKHSRENLLDRCRSADINVTEEIGTHNKRILAIG